MATKQKAAKRKKARAVGKASRGASGTSARAPLVRLENGPVTLHLKLAARVRAALRELRIADTLAEIHLEPPKAPARRSLKGAAPAASAAHVPCPADTVRRMVCAFRDGTFVCEPRCVPRANAGGV